MSLALPARRLRLTTRLIISPIVVRSVTGSDTSMERELASEESCRPNEQEHDQQDKGEGDLILRVARRAQSLREPDRESADERAVEAAETADDRRHEGRGHRARAHGHDDEAVVPSEDDAGG